MFILMKTSKQCFLIYGQFIIILNLSYTMLMAIIALFLKQF